MNTKVFIDQIPVKSEKTSLKEQVEEKYGRNARVVDIIEKTKQHEYCGPYHDWWTVYTVRIEVDVGEKARQFLGEVEK